MGTALRPHRFGDPGAGLRRRRAGVSVDALERRQFLSAAPSLDLLSDEYVAVGRSVNVRGLVADADSSLLTVTVDFGDGTIPAAGLVNTATNPLFSVTHVYTTRATFPLSVTVEDGGGGVTTQTQSVTATDMAGAVFEDDDDNGLRDFGDAPVAGATVFLDADANGRADPGEATAATDAAGFYHFDGLSPGIYKVGYVAPAGWRITNPDPVPPSATTVGDGFGGQRSFGISQRARVVGTVFWDLYGNGVRDGTDPTWTDYTPYIDVNDDGYFDRTVDRRADLRVGAGGTYLFRNLEPGVTYTIRLGPSAPINAEPPGPRALPGTASVTLPAGAGNAAYHITPGIAEVVGADFGFTSPEGKVDGLVFDDANHNGLRDLAEAQVPRRVVFIDADGDGALDPDERRVLSGIIPGSNGNGGSYQFAIPPGTSTVRQILPEKWVQSAPAGGGGLAATVVAGQATRVQGDFGSYAVPEVVATHVFYKGSAFDSGIGNNSNPNDHAIAPDKTAALPFQPGSFGSVTNYSRGLNGIMLDIAHLFPGVRALTADDIRFRVTDGRGGLGSGGSSWADAPAPASISIRPGEGDGGSDRVTLTWPDGAIKNTWLEVSIRPDGRIGPTDNGRFYFGNLDGETGDAAAAGTPLRVSALDLGAVKRALNTLSGITGPCDFNRDGRVNALDLGAVKANLNRSLGMSDASVAVARTAPAPAPGESRLLVGRVWDEDAGLPL